MKALVFRGVEEQIVASLRGASEALCMDAPVRIAGGFLRDKVLQRPSKDIDVVVEGIDPTVFGKAVQGIYYRKYGKRMKWSKIETGLKHFKAVDTIRLSIEGYDVDIVHMRHDEEYHPRDRSPTVSFTADNLLMRDYWRRDFTMNGLYYDIPKGNIVDITGRGIKDILNKIIRAIPDPLPMLLDDPLRCFRAVRFATTLQATIDPPLLSALLSIPLHYYDFLSKERIYQEVSKTLSPHRYMEGYHLLYMCGLDRVVFQSPNSYYSLYHYYHTLFSFTSPTIYHPMVFHILIGKNKGGKKGLYEQYKLPRHVNQWIIDVRREEKVVKRYVEMDCPLLWQVWKYRVGKDWKLILLWSMMIHFQPKSMISKVMDKVHHLPPLELPTGSQLMDCYHRKPGPWIRSELLKSIFVQTFLSCQT